MLYLFLCITILIGSASFLFRVFKIFGIRTFDDNPTDRPVRTFAICVIVIFPFGSLFAFMEVIDINKGRLIHNWAKENGYTIQGIYKANQYSTGRKASIETITGSKYKVIINESQKSFVIEHGNLILGDIDYKIKVVE